MANTGGDIGWTSCGTRTPPARIPTIRCRTRGVIATGSSRRFNEDLPYDEFVRDQIAGDLLRERRRRNRAPIASWPRVIWRSLGGSDTTSTRTCTSRWRIRSTRSASRYSDCRLAVARCHDHKFDPLTAPTITVCTAFLTALGSPSRVASRSNSRAISCRCRFPRNERAAS